MAANIICGRPLMQQNMQKFRSSLAHILHRQPDFSAFLQHAIKLVLCLQQPRNAKNKNSVVLCLQQPRNANNKKSAQTGRSPSQAARHLGFLWRHSDFRIYFDVITTILNLYCELHIHLQGIYLQPLSVVKWKRKVTC